MGYGIKLKLWGDYACFTRPEMKGERVSYDVMTPSAARGIIESIYWKPAIRWVVDRIHVINKIEFTNVRRNEVSEKIAVTESTIKSAMSGGKRDFYLVAPDVRQQRAAMVLRDVCYIVEAHFELTEKAGPDDTEEKHYNMALRRIRGGQCHHQPCFGTREFAAHFAEATDEDYKSFYGKDGKRELGWMLWDIDFSNPRELQPVFFKAQMENGVIDVANQRKAR